MRGGWILPNLRAMYAIIAKTRDFALILHPVLMAGDYVHGGLYIYGCRKLRALSHAGAQKLSSGKQIIVTPV